MKVNKIRAATLAALMVLLVLVVAVPASAQSGASSEVSIIPSSQSVATGGTATYDIVVDNAPDGVDSYDYVVSTSDADNASITDFEFAGLSESDATAALNITSNGSSADVVGGLAALDGGSDVVIGTITVEAGSNASTVDLSVSTNQIIDGNNNEMNITDENNAVVTVTAGPGDITGDGNVAQDPDGDGQYEDINGDGVVGLVDLRPYFGYLNSDNGYQPGLDWNEDGVVDLRDLRPFFEEISG
jgi:hypothetical protein